MSAKIKESLYPRGFEYLLLTSVKTLFPNSQKVLQSSNSIFAFTYLIQLDNLQNSILSYWKYSFLILFSNSCFIILLC